MQQHYLANALATLVSGIQYEGLPVEVVGKAKACLIDNLGLAAGGSDSRASRAVLGTLARLGGPEEARG